MVKKKTSKRPAPKTSTNLVTGIALEDRSVRVRVSPKVLHDLDAITEVLHRTLGQLGCEACCSGHDIRFDIHRDFIVDERLNVRPS